VQAEAQIVSHFLKTMFFESLVKAHGVGSYYGTASLIQTLAPAKLL